jgi:NAD(P) transhydrogenase subunit alpha
VERLPCAAYAADVGNQRHLGIIVVGALLQIGHGGWISFLSFIAVLIASINIFGGFTVTQRMLKMFRKG